MLTIFTVSVSTDDTINSCVVNKPYLFLLISQLSLFFYHYFRCNAFVDGRQTLPLSAIITFHCDHVGLIAVSLILDYF